MNEIIYFYFSYGNFLEGFSRVEIENNNQQITVLRYFPFDQTNQEEAKISVKKYQSFIHSLLKIVQSWEYEYINKDIVDGIHWNVLISNLPKNEVKRLDETTKDMNDIDGISCYYGSNGYPENFLKLENLLRRYKFVKGNL